MRSILLASILALPFTSQHATAQTHCYSSGFGNYNCYGNGSHTRVSPNGLGGTNIEHRPSILNRNPLYPSTQRCSSYPGAYGSYSYSCN